MQTDITPILKALEELAIKQDLLASKQDLLASKQGRLARKQKGAAFNQERVLAHVCQELALIKADVIAIKRNQGILNRIRCKILHWLQR
jgi:hypothetical protein